MQFYFRTGRNTGVGLGPLGLLIVAPFYLAVLVAIAFVYVVIFAIALFAVLVAALRERRRKRTRP
jgi:hypothetical protein